MNTDNTQGAAEPSPASAGSHAAVAWVVWYPEGTALGAYFTDDERKADLWRDAGATVDQLYRYPALTDEERKVIWTVAEAYAENDGDPECERIARIMQGLWQRTK